MQYTGAFVFGDSLVDSGNALKLAQWYGTLTFSDLPEGAPSAADGYFHGRFSDGYTFADLIANKTIGTVTQPVFPYGYEDPWLGIPVDPFAGDPHGNNLNFAYGGSQIRQGDEVVPDMDGQTDAFKNAVDGHADPNALYMVTMGGNDVRSLVPNDGVPTAQADAYAALDHAANTMFTELRGLVNVGVHNILITGVPDVGLIPDYDLDGNLVLSATEQMRADAATDYSIYLDTLIRTVVVPQLQALGANVTYVPVMSYVDSHGTPVVGGLDAIIPEIAALHGLTTEQLTGNLLLYQNLVFFDDIHPNAQAHALVGSYMYSQLTGTPWVETMPLAGSDVDYKLTATIGAAGEVDSQSVYLVAGTTYTFEMLGVSSLGNPASVGDTMLKLLSSGGILVRMDDDSGAGFDAHLTFTVATSGTYTLQMSAVGMLTGTYSLQAAVVSGAAMTAGNTYVVSNASTLVLESADGVGQDVVKASVSYALAAGSEVEVLRTTNDLGTAAINLAGNEFAQTIVGNRGSNILEGKGGADVMTGGGGKDTFVLSNSAVTSSGNVDRITDYAKGEIVDVTQILKVAAGTNVVTGGYVRVTTGGLIQVDVDGGGNNWVTLSTVNGTGAVTIRYLSGGTATSLAVTRVADTQTTAAAANTNVILTGAVAAAGAESMAAAAEPHSTDHALATGHHGAIGLISSAISVEPARMVEMEGREAFDQHALVSPMKIAPHLSHDSPARAVALQRHGLADPAQHAEAAGHDQPAHGSPVASPTINPATMVAEMAAQAPTSQAKVTGEVGRVLADALAGGEPHGPNIDALLDAATHGHTHWPTLAASHLAFVHGEAVAFVAGLHAQPMPMFDIHEAVVPLA